MSGPSQAELLGREYDYDPLRLAHAVLTAETRLKLERSKARDAYSIVRQIAADDPSESFGVQQSVPICRFCGGFSPNHVPLCVYRQAREWVAEDE